MLIRSKQTLSGALILFFSIFSVNTFGATDGNFFAQKESLTSSYAKKSNLKEAFKSNKKIGSTIQRLIDEPSLMQLATSRNATQTKEQSKVQVYLKVLSVSKDSLSELEGLGLEVEIANAKLNKIQGWVDLNDINEITKLDNVMHVSKPSYGHQRVGSRITEGDAALQSDLVRELGFTGQGVRVGVISDGSAGLAQAQNSGDLPDNVTLFSSCEIGTTTPLCAEGTAMAEIIHDIAPDAELAIADGLDTSLDFIQSLEQLVTVFEADIIVDDIGFFSEPYFEDGDIAQAVNELPDNIIYISAAGNSGQRHLQNTFESLMVQLIQGAGTLNLNTHNFGLAAGQSSSSTLPFTLGAGESTCAVLQWNDPFANDLNSNIAINDYDLRILNDANLNVASVLATSDSFQNTIEFACITNTQTFNQTFHLLVTLFNQTTPTQELEINFSNNNPTIPAQFQVVEDSVFGHPASERAIAVGTINIQDPLQDEIARFSSQGPSRIDFPVRQDRQKPDITGVDGVSVTGSGGFTQTFFGTSAAAPHIAGITALLKSANPTASRSEIESALLGGAVDFGPLGNDNIFGAGRASALDSLQLIQPNNGNNSDFDILNFLPAILDAAKNQN